jgi:hypothetical protein
MKLFDNLSGADVVMMVGGCSMVVVALIGLFFSEGPPQRSLESYANLCAPGFECLLISTPDPIKPKKKMWVHVYFGGGSVPVFVKRTDLKKLYEDRKVFLLYPLELKE